MKVFFEQSIEGNAILNILRRLEEEGEDTKEYRAACTEAEIKHQIRTLVSQVFFKKNSKEKVVLEEFNSFIKKKNDYDEKMISKYLSVLIISSFLNNIEREKKTQKYFKTKNLISFVFFLEEYFKEERNAEMLDILYEEQELINEEDFFIQIKQKADKIFLTAENDNSSAVFALKDFLQESRKDFLNIKYENEAERSIHCKPFALEKIFYF